MALKLNLATMFRLVSFTLLSDCHMVSRAVDSGIGYFRRAYDIEQAA